MSLKVTPTSVVSAKCLTICLIFVTCMAPTSNSPLVDLIQHLTRPLQNKTWFIYLESDICVAIQQKHNLNIAESLLLLNNELN